MSKKRERENVYKIQNKAMALRKVRDSLRRSEYDSKWTEMF